MSGDSRDTHGHRALWCHSIGHHSNHSQTRPEWKPAGISILEAARPGGEGPWSHSIQESSTSARAATGRLAQASRTRADDDLCAIGNVQLGQDVRNVVAHRLGGQRKSIGNGGVVLSSATMERISRSRSVSSEKARIGAIR
jgi:hypothetical protein